jgi:methyl coenzyme M reductase gamma subunit
MSEVVHIFTLHKPGSKRSQFVRMPSAPGDENLTDDEIREMVGCVQKLYPTDKVRYLTLAEDAGYIELK